jgi:hypothetical protein
MGLKSLYSITDGKTNLKRFNISICETVMKNRFISPIKARLVRFKAVNSVINIKAQSEINPAICQLILILSSKLLNLAGYL